MSYKQMLELDEKIAQNAAAKKAEPSKEQLDLPSHIKASVDYSDDPFTGNVNNRNVAERLSKEAEEGIVDPNKEVVNPNGGTPSAPKPNLASAKADVKKSKKINPPAAAATPAVDPNAPPPVWKSNA